MKHAGHDGGRCDKGTCQQAIPTQLTSHTRVPRYTGSNQVISQVGREIASRSLCHNMMQIRQRSERNGKQRGCNMCHVVQQRRTLVRGSSTWQYLVSQHGRDSDVPGRTQARHQDRLRQHCVPITASPATARCCCRLHSKNHLNILKPTPHPSPLAPCLHKTIHFGRLKQS